eukprot:3476309-Rhodomonas_salina.1
MPAPNFTYARSEWVWRFGGLGVWGVWGYGLGVWGRGFMGFRGAFWELRWGTCRYDSCGPSTSIACICRE